MSALRLKLGLFLVVVGSVVASLTAAGAAGASTPAPGHAFSDPVWFPFHTPVRVGCIGSAAVNNGPTSGTNRCNNDHPGYFAMNISVPWKVPPGILNPQPHPPVYAAGAGVVIRADTGSRACETSGKVLSGNQVWISHGGGIVSVYQHLLGVYVRRGAVVTPRSVIGTAGATGAECDSTGHPVTAYLDFQVRHWGGSSTLTRPISSLYGCVGTSTRAAAWPAGIARSTYLMPPAVRLPASLPTTWIGVPLGSGIQLDPANWNCVRANGAGTPNPPTGLRRSGTTLTWPVVRGATSYTVELQIPRAGSWGVPCSPFAQPGCTYGFYLFSATSRPHFTTARTGTYRMRVYAHNGIGWSQASAWLTVP